MLHVEWACDGAPALCFQACLIMGKEGIKVEEDKQYPGAYLYLEEDSSQLPKISPATISSWASIPPKLSSADLARL